MLAVGEIGLDYHYDFSPREIQRDVFIRQLELAREAAKPIVIHTREAWSDTTAILREHYAVVAAGSSTASRAGRPKRGRRLRSRLLHLSFGGVLTFPKAEAVREAARMAPLDRILVETDAPYLAPVPHRGKRNEPAFLVDTVRKLAAVREIPVEEVAAVTTRNFDRLCLRYTE